jgi:hypothetical protein
MTNMEMNSQLSAVMQRRGELLARIASQRRQMAEIGIRLEAPLEMADRGVNAVRFLRSHPVLVAGLIAVMAIRRRGVAGMAIVAWQLWNGYCNFTGHTARLSSRRYNQ